MQAMTETGELLIPAILSKQKLENVRLQKRFYCPDCNDQVIFRAGQKVIPHFAHKHAADCSQKGGESTYHMKGKLQLYQWLKRQYKEVYLEKHIPTINQRPDILLKIAHRTIAIELQCSVIDPRIIRKRNNGYKKAGIKPIWLLGANCFKRIGQRKIKINSFTLEVLQKFSAETVSHILYYCSDRHGFFKASDLHMTNSHHALAHLNYYNAHQTTFPQLIKSERLYPRELFTSWLYEKKRLRLGHGRHYGNELQWRRWLYEKGIYPQLLPSAVHLPIASQYKMNVPAWHWQSRFLLEFLYPLQVHECFSLTEAEDFLHPYQKSESPFLLIETREHTCLEYLRLLTVLGYVQELDNQLFKKTCSIPFPTNIEDALETDRQVFRRLLQATDEKIN